MCYVFPIDIRLLPPCKAELSAEHQEQNSSLVQEEHGESAQIKEEQEELLLRPEEGLTPLAVKTEEIDEQTETVASSIPAEHMKIQADEEGCGTSQPTGDD